MRLTANQLKRLSAIVESDGPVAWWNTATDRSLLRRALVERCDHTKQLAPQIKFVTHLCRATVAGREALKAAQ